MRRVAKGIRPGGRFKQGEVIGYFGSTGRSSGPPLHYEVIKNGRRVNPRTIKAATGENLKGNALSQFKRVVAQIDRDYGRAFASKPQDTKLAQK